MKTFLAACCGLLVLPLAAFGCGGQEAMNEDVVQTFATAEQAAAKAREDLLEVLRGKAGLQAGVETERVERAQPAAPIERFDVSFDKLLAAESLTRFAALVDAPRDTVVPLVADGNLVTIVTIKHDAPGWRIVGLTDKALTDDLAAVRAASGGEDATAIYEVPNLDVRVYAVASGEGERLFTNYPARRFSLREPLSTDALVPALRLDARAFQEKYGVTLQREKLLR